jgi:hypothetical protein
LMLDAYSGLNDKGEFELFDEKVDSEVKDV